MIKTSTRQDDWQQLIEETLTLKTPEGHLCEASIEAERQQMAPDLDATLMDMPEEAIQRILAAAK